MLLVVLGAGASHGCVPNGGPSALPITTTLFESSAYGVPDANQFAEHARPIVARVASALRQDVPSSSRDVEEILGAIAERAEAIGGDARTQLIAMRFWLFERIRRAQADVVSRTAGVTLYTALLNMLDDWAADHRTDVTLVTFNYDTLLDQALIDHSPRVAKYAEMNRGVKSCALQGGRWTLLRPHGSIDWVRQWKTDDNVQRTVLSRVESFERMDPLDTRFKRVLATMPDDPLEQTNLEDGSTEISVPAIAVPLNNKSAFECPREHIATMVDAITKASRVVCIGWRGREAHFTQLLKHLPADSPLVFIDPKKNAAMESVRAMGGALGHRQLGFKEASFEDVLGDPEDSPLVGPRSCWMGI